MSLEGAIAVQRFGLGGRQGDIAAASGNPKQWLLNQLEGVALQPQALDGRPFLGSGALVGELIEYRRQRRHEQAAGTYGKTMDDPAKAFFKEKVKDYLREMAARFALGFTTEKPFSERLVWFWSNHFTVSALSGPAVTEVGAFEREAIRPHITGKFEDMLVAVTRHPAMQLYLNNVASIGPNSLAGKLSGRGLNENLGRELMELHTLGVDGGYTQADVIALAKILTGWSLDKDGTGQGFRYYPARHEPGDVVLRGKTYPSTGDDGQGLAALHDLAHDPATARHVARQFATAFVSDNPSPESVARLEHVFNNTGGDLKAFAVAVVDDPAAWKPDAGKLRSPIAYITAALRMLDWPQGGDREQQLKGIMAATRLMGEFPLAASSPKGWPLKSDAWSGPDAILNRLQWARELGNKMPQNFDAMRVADGALGPLIKPATRTAMKSASNGGEALALLVASPEFQRS
jgi:uncharacterized protein (DUF1800 family)